VFDFLPPVDPVPLGGAPLAQVIAQIKFNGQSSLATHQGIGVLHDALADRYPRLLAEQQAVITAAPGGVSTAQIPQWRMTDLNGEWAVVLGPEQLTLETTAYAAWDSLRDRLGQAVDALTDVARPRVRERVGLRYVNHVPADESGSFTGRIRAELLGLSGVAGWRDAMTASLSQTVLIDENTQMALRYGSGAPIVQGDVFVLDIDCAHERPVEFDIDEVMAYFDTLNDAAYRCFCFCVPATFRASLLG
jgi:uncharacterized protein (TIGR04255 family)